MFNLGRRGFIALIGGAAAWPVAARAQQGERVRHVGVLLGWSESDPQFRSWFAVFVQELARLGWANGGNVRIEQRGRMRTSSARGGSLRSLSSCSPT
jgi:putative tryptophan/tyrosine transport system substrate-binding protein